MDDLVARSLPLLAIVCAANVAAVLVRFVGQVAGVEVPVFDLVLGLARHGLLLAIPLALAEIRANEDVSGRRFYPVTLALVFTYAAEFFAWAFPHPESEAWVRLAHAFAWGAVFVLSAAAASHFKRFAWGALGLMVLAGFLFTAGQPELAALTHAGAFALGAVFFNRLGKAVER